MRKTLKRIFIIIFTITISLVNSNVFSYTFQNEEIKSTVYGLRQKIYDLTDYFYENVDISKYSNSSSYYGVCSTVIVDSKTYTLEEYVAGVVKAEVGSETQAFEALKAHAVAARTYLLKTTDCSRPVTNGQSYQAFKETTPGDIYTKAADATAGQVVQINNELILTEYTSYPNAIFTIESSDKWQINFQKIRGNASTAWTWVGPNKQIVLNTNNYKPQKGAPSLEHHYGMSSVVAVYLDVAKNYSYEQILKLFYGDNITINTLSDGNYIGDISFVSNEFGNIYYFNQLDYKDYYYSSDVKVPQYDDNTATIASHGCGPTSLSMVISSYKKEPHGPIEVTQKLCSAGGCTSGGSYMGGLKTVAEQYGYKGYYTNGQGVIDALGNGSLVIALMGPGTFTSGGHYIVLTGVRSDGYVSVADPASRTRTNTKWFTFNLVLEQAKADFLVITK